jgi:hypothetical protein
MIRACEAMLRLWSDFVDAGHNSHEEATRISNLIRNARAFPPADAERFRSLLVAYTESVAGPEWESMDEGDPSPVMQRHYDAVWEAPLRGRRQDLAGAVPPGRPAVRGRRLTRYACGSEPGRPKRGNTAGSTKPVISAIRSPSNVSTWSTVGR